MSQIRDKKAHRKHIATMNPINAKSVQLIELHAFYYLLLLSFIAVYLTSSKIIYYINQQVTNIWYKYDILLYNTL